MKRPGVHRGKNVDRPGGSVVRVVYPIFHYTRHPPPKSGAVSRTRERARPRGQHPTKQISLRFSKSAARKVCAALSCIRAPTSTDVRHETESANSGAKVC